MFSYRLPTSRLPETFPLNRYLFLVGLFACAPIIQILGVSLFLLLIYCYLLYLLLVGRLTINRKSSFTPVLLVTCLSASVSFFLAMPSGYITNNVKGIINLIAIYFFASSVESKMPSGGYVESLLNGLRIGCRVQAIWIFVQYFCWHLLEIDINSLLFTDLLHMVENASQYKASGFIPTGFCWNAGGIAPVFFLGFFLNNGFLWKAAIFASALLTQSLTLTLGMIVSVFLSMAICPRQHITLHELFSSKRKVLCFCAITLFVITLVAFNIKGVTNALVGIWSAFSYRMTGLLSGGLNLDSSSAAHLGYLVNLPKLLLSSPVIAVLFGYGVNCSGFPYSRIIGQYPHETWIVECDVTNTILNYGLIGFCFYYRWLITGFISLKANKRLFCAIGVLTLMGLTYNLQYIWVILLEMLLFDSSSEIDDGVNDVQSVRTGSGLLLCKSGVKKIKSMF